MRAAASALGGAKPHLLMRVELNLASRPTVNRRRFNVLAGSALLLLLLLAVAQGVAYFHSWGSDRAIGLMAERMRAEIARMESERNKLEQQLQQPEAREVIERAQFLNSLILQKSISWTQLFMDLEKLMPSRAQVISIRPEVLDTQQIRLEMSVAGESMDQLLEFVRRIETSEKFGTPVLQQEVPPGAGASDPTIRLGLTVLYAQK